MRRPLLPVLLLALGIALLLAGVALRSDGGLSPGPVASGPPPGPYRGSEPPGDFRIPDFALRDYRGRLIRTRALRGRVVLITFLDTDCRTKCPIIAGEIGSAMRLLTPAERPEVAALAITVNPASDNPRTVRSFLRRRHALGELNFLLGRVQKLRPVWRSFHILAAAETGNADVHSADVRVFDRRGKWVSTLHAGVDLTPGNLAHDLRAAGRLGQRLRVSYEVPPEPGFARREA
jgi:cytochrome oxidase Cu insertion factor (SCO1/SenC/PrrC family)